MKKLLADAAARAERYTSSIAGRRVAPLPEDIARLETFGGCLPENSSDPASVLAMLDDLGSFATVASTGGSRLGASLSSQSTWLASATGQEL